MILIVDNIKYIYSAILCKIEGHFLNELDYIYKS